MLRHRHETLIETQRRQARYSSGKRRSAQVGQGSAGSVRGGGNLVLLIVGWLWLLLWGALTLWFAWGRPVDSSPDVVWLIGAVTVVGALVLVGLGWFVARPSGAEVVGSFAGTLLVVAFIFLLAWLGSWLSPGSSGCYVCW